jgi:hypothetical protein
MERSSALSQPRPAAISRSNQLPARHALHPGSLPGRVDPARWAAGPATTKKPAGRAGGSVGRGWRSAPKRGLIWPWASAARRIRAPRRCRILLGRVIMRILSGGMGTGLRADRGRIRMLRFIGFVICGRLIVLLLPGRIAARPRNDGLGRRGGRGRRRGGACACWRQRRNRLRRGRCGNADQQTRAKNGRFQQARHSVSPTLDYSWITLWRTTRHRTNDNCASHR